MSAHLSQRLDAYLDDALSSDERRAADEHLSGCAHCRARLDEGLALRRLLGQVDPVPTATTTGELWSALEPRLEPRSSGLGVGWLWGSFMVLGTFLAQAVSLTLFVAAVAGFAGLRLPALIGTPGWALPSWPSLLPDGTFAVAAANVLVPFVLLLVTTGLALGFLGWALALQRRRLAYAVTLA